MPGTEVINVTAPADPCGYVFAPQNKAAGGTALEWAHYRLCQVTHYLSTGAHDLLMTFGGEAAILWTRLRALPQAAWNAGSNAILSAGNWVKAQADALVSDIHDFANRVQGAITGAVGSVRGPIVQGTNVLLWGLLIVGTVAAVAWAES